MGRRRRNRLSLHARRRRVERLEPRQLLAATPIQVLAAGANGLETAALEIDGVEVARWPGVGGDYAGRVFETFSYTHPTTVTADSVVVRFLDSPAGGGDLRVDGVVIDGRKYESESPATFNTGAWDVAAQAIVPRYAELEYLHANFGELRYSTALDTQIAIRAAGATGQERMALLLDGVEVAAWENVGGDYNARNFQTFAYSPAARVSVDRLRVAFTNDGRTAAGADRNLRVDGVTVDGVTYESEAPSTFSTGTWKDGTITPGYPELEYLHGNGYFRYAEAAVATEPLVVYAAGQTGEETIEVRVDGATVATFAGVGGDFNGRVFVPLATSVPGGTRLDQIEVAFVNDTLTPVDRNLRIDAIELAGVRHETEAVTTFSTGTWKPLLGVRPGFVQSELLHANGVMRYGQDNAEAGVLSLGATQYAVGEGGGFVDVQFVRTSARGAVTIDYTTVDSVALAGFDYTAASGTLVLDDGQLSGTVRIAILDDSTPEGAETFNLAADRVTGGAFLGAPRTTTITIQDDEAPSPGDGRGLRGEYFAGANFESSLFTRTDATIDFTWGLGSPAAEVPVDNFSVVWTGLVEPLYSETYTFRTTTDDGVRLWVDGQLIVDRWTGQAPTEWSGQIALEAGRRYDLRMEYNEYQSGAVAQLRWQSARQPLQIVPRSQLYSEAVVPDDGQFVAQTLFSGLTQPTAIDFARVGGSDYVFIAQKDGRVRLAVDGVLQPDVFVDYRTPVNNVRDRGLLGLAVHPDFENNPYVYLLYTYDPPETQSASGLAAPDNYGNRVARLTRLTADAASGFRTAAPGSGVVLLGTNSTWENISFPDRDSTQEIGLPPSGLDADGGWVPDVLITDSQSHTIGALDFGPDGSLYVTNGDGTSYGRVDPRTTRVQDLDSLSGKVLRIDPLTGMGYADNPFYTGDPSDDRSKVVNYGLRNPFRLAVHPTTGVPYVGDVGWNSWEEINGGVGQNFGWPYYEGGDTSGSSGGDSVNRRTGGYRDLPEAQAFYAAGGDSLATPPLWSRSHSAGGVAIVMGDFYTGAAYPEQFRNALFFTDFGDPAVRAITLDSQGAFAGSLVVTGGIGSLIEMSMGPDGRMWYVDVTGSVGRIDYQPTAAAAFATSESLAAPAEEPAIARFVQPFVPSEPLIDSLMTLAAATQPVMFPSASGVGFVATTEPLSPLAFAAAPESTASADPPAEEPLEPATVDAALELLLLADADLAAPSADAPDGGDPADPVAIPPSEESESPLAVEL
ncbi:carbohydrate-binding domain-containing protein [Botrimarina sp.]|uniref:carbohydrate-binding domain-containing protein n=1 Tax=Botrimarina sp. TaxID=2795802 RepID=UPI0032EBD58D